MPLGEGTIPRSLRDRVEREAPELDLIPDSLIIRDLKKRFENSKWGQEGGTLPAAAYLAFKIKDIVAALQEFPRLGPLRDEMEPIDFAIGASGDFGVSLPHLFTHFTERTMQIYQKHRPAIIAHLIETVGVEKLAATLPELKDVKIEYPDFGYGRFGIQVPHYPEWEGAAQIVERLRSGLPGNLAKDFEKLLWDWTPPEDTDSPEKTKKDLQILAAKLTQFYFSHRNNLTSSSEAAIPLSMETAESKLEAMTAPFWELDLLVLKDPIRKAKNEAKGRSVSPKQSYIRVFTLHGAGSYRDVGADEALIRQVEQARVRGHDVETATTDIVIRPQDTIKIIQASPYLHMCHAVLWGIPMSIAQMKRVLPEEPAINNQIGKDERRVAAFALMGFNPGWIFEKWGERVFDLYKKNRERVIDKADFTEHVAELPEIQVDPKKTTNTVESLDGRGRVSVRHSQLLLRILEILSSEVDRFETLSKELKRILDKEKRTLEAFNKATARFYLEHRAEILSHLKPWPKESPKPAVESAFIPIVPGEPPQDLEDLVREVSNYPELEEVKFRPRVKKITFFPGAEMHLAIAMLMRKFWVPHPIKEAFTALERTFKPNDLSDSYYQTVAEFYKTHRDEILAAKNKGG